MICELTNHLGILRKLVKQRPNCLLIHAYIDQGDCEIVGRRSVWAGDRIATMKLDES